MNPNDALIMHEKIKRAYRFAQGIRAKRDPSYVMTGGERSIMKALDTGATYLVSQDIFMRLTELVTLIPDETRLNRDLFSTPCGVILFDHVAYNAGGKKIKIGGICWDATATVVTPPNLPEGAASVEDPGVLVCSMEVPSPDMRRIAPLDPTYYATWRYKHTLLDSLKMNIKWATDKDDPEGVVTNSGRAGC